jgi:hypothetical protein
MEIKNLIERYPTLYHMAEGGTWPSIKANGLLSATAVLDRFGIHGGQRLAIEQGHRPEKMLIGPAGAGIVLRDQKPMYPDRLEGALNDGTTPAQWYKFLNGRVFMWAQEARLFGLLGARQYRMLEHDVLTIDSKALLSAHGEKVWLCRMNSGNTFPVPHSRGMGDFMRISDYPAKERTGAPAKEVVEVVVDYSIPDIAVYVTEVRRIKGKEVLRTIPL